MVRGCCIGIRIVDVADNLHQGHLLGAVHSHDPADVGLLEGTFGRNGLAEEGGEEGFDGRHGIVVAVLDNGCKILLVNGTISDGHDMLPHGIDVAAGG